MSVIQDAEFGKITIRRSAAASQIKIRVAPDGNLYASLPPYAPILLVRHLLNTSRKEIRSLIDQAKPEYNYQNGMQIGKSHTLIIQESSSNQVSVQKHQLQIIVKIPKTHSLNDPVVSRKIRDEIIAALRIEAKSYLPRRLAYLAKQYNFQFSQTRFSHSSGRWGSCNSNGTISLNIALMKLPFELIDYVIIHELSHTVEMNHSSSFWKLVESADPKYKVHRKILRTKTPTI